MKKSMFKKILALLIAASCTLCGCKTADPTENFYEYEDVISETGDIIGVKIIACSLDTEEIRIPSSIGGKNVLSIGHKDNIGAFEGCPSSVENIVIPEGVEEIENGAFINSVSLKSVILPESLLYLGNSAFNYCEGLTEITIPENITGLSGTFSGCTSLERVQLSEGLTYIGQSTFKDCVSLEKLELPSTVTDIESYAFPGCTSLSELKFNDGLLSIGEMAFDGCESLTEVTVPDTVETIGRDAFNGCVDIVVHYRGMSYNYAQLFNIYTLEEGEEPPEWFIPNTEPQQ